MVAASFYLALMTAECLAITGAEGPVIVEGPFSRNAAFRDMLAAATGRPVHVSASATGTSIGAALLYDMNVPAETDPPAALPAADLSDYARQWRSRA